MGKKDSSGQGEGGIYTLGYISKQGREVHELIPRALVERLVIPVIQALTGIDFQALIPQW
jgi:hypothetical protein